MGGSLAVPSSFSAECWSSALCRYDMKGGPPFALDGATRPDRPHVRRIVVLAPGFAPPSYVFTCAELVPCCSAVVRDSTVTMLRSRRPRRSEPVIPLPELIESASLR